jgi:hypothetical protein
VTYLTDKGENMIEYQVIDEIEQLEREVEWVIEQRKRWMNKVRDWEPDVIDYLKEKEEL